MKQQKNTRKAAKTKASRQQKAARLRTPWLFLFALVLFSGFLTYAWGVWYIPSLPRAEIPPYLTDADISAGSGTVPSAGTSAPAPETPDSPESSKTPDTAAPSTDAPKPSVPEPKPEGQPRPPEPKPEPKPETKPETKPIPKPETEPPVSEPAKVKRKPGVYNILCAGRDAAAYNTDVLILLSYDTKRQTACAAQIPRDTFVDGRKVNALCAKYRGEARRAGASDPTADGMEKLCSTLESALSVQIDHWVLIDLSAFRAVVDAVGGVDLDVPCDMDYDDDAQDLHIHLKAGPQTLDGAKAEQFVRFRRGYIRGDLGRTDMQKLFLSALFARVQSGIPLSSLPSLAKTAVSAADTDLSVTDLLFFLKSVRGLEAENVTLCTLPGTDAREYGDRGAWYYILSREAVCELVSSRLHVYETALLPEQFDAKRRLTDASRPALDALYRRYVPAVFYTAKGASAGEVQVPMT